MNRVVVLAAIALVSLSGCFSYSQSSESLWRDAPNYVAMKSALPPAKAYVYGSGTVLEFPQGGTPAWIRITDSAGSNIAFEKVGRFIRISQRLPVFTAWINGVPRDFSVVGGRVPVMLARASPADHLAEPDWIESGTEEQRRSRLSTSADEEIAQRLSALEAEIERMRLKVPPANSLGVVTSSVKAAEPVGSAMKPLEAKAAAARSGMPPSSEHDAMASSSKAAEPAGAMKPLEAKTVATSSGMLPSSAHDAMATSTKAPEPAGGAATSKNASWAISDEKTLKEVVSRWASQAGVQVRWESTRDLPVSDSARSGSFDGDFRTALTQLASKFSFADAPLGIRFLEQGTVLKVYDLPSRS
jgi:hypothetical protein